VTVIWIRRRLNICGAFDPVRGGSKSPKKGLQFLRSQPMPPGEAWPVERIAILSQQLL
jgi:hypothetical protein